MPNSSDQRIVTRVLGRKKYHERKRKQSRTSPNNLREVLQQEEKSDRKEQKRGPFLRLTVVLSLTVKSGKRP